MGYSDYSMVVMRIVMHGRKKKLATCKSKAPYNLNLKQLRLSDRKDRTEPYEEEERVVFELIK